jgi:sulfite reductase (NADPH) flavoprotein alpha-component
MGDTGRQITGACTLMLVFFCLSGLYLRWPRKALDWRTWLTLDWAKKGRAFNWDLHAVAGTWCLLFYLLFALTGLFWSYEWYREGLNKLLADAPPPASSKSAVKAVAATAAKVDKNAPPLVVDYDAIWANLKDAAGPACPPTTCACRRWRPAGEPVLPAGQRRHPRAFNTLVLDPATGQSKHERYTDKSSRRSCCRASTPCTSAATSACRGASSSPSPA